jgi:hypothetical protein
MANHGFNFHIISERYMWEMGELMGSWGKGLELGGGGNGAGCGKNWGGYRRRFLSVAGFVLIGRRLLESGKAWCAAEGVGSPVDGRARCGESAGEPTTDFDELSRVAASSIYGESKGDRVCRPAEAVLTKSQGGHRRGHVEFYYHRFYGADEAFL